MTTEELKLLVSGDASGAKEAVESLGGAFEGLFGTIVEGVASGELLAEGIKKVAEVLSELPGELLEITEKGSKVSDVEAAFQRLSGSVGAAEETLGALRDGTRGTVGDFALMQVANKAISDGAHLSTDQFKLMADGARLLAKQSGGDTATALDALSQAMVTGRAKALNLIGIHINADEALARYSATIGKSVSDFTNQDKVAATSAETMRQLTVRVAEAGDQQLSFGERIAVVKTAFENFEDDLGVAIARSPVLAAGFNQVGKELTGAFGGKDAVIRGIVSVIDSLAIGAVLAAKAGVEGVKSVGDAIYEYESVYYAAIGVMAERLLDFIGPSLAAADVLKNLPGAAGTAFALAETGLQKLTVGVAGLGAQAKGWSKDATDGAATFDTKMNAVDASLGRVAFSMVVAQMNAKATGDAGATAGKQMADGFEMPDKAAAKLAAQLAKLREQWTAEAEKFALESIRRSEQTNQKEADTRAKALTAQLQLLTEYSAKVEDMNLSGTDLAIVQINREHDAKIAELQKVPDLTGWAYDQAKIKIDAYYQHLRDLANGTADTIEERMRKQGVFTRDDLQLTADNATRDYQQMLDSGEYTTAELAAAWKKMTAANTALESDWTQRTESLFSNLASSIEQIFMGGSGSLADVFKALGQEVEKDLVVPMLQSVGVIESGVVNMGSGISAAIGTKEGGGAVGTISGLASGLGGAAAASGMFGAAIAGSTIAIGAATMGIGAAAIGVAMLIKHFTDSQGRDAIEKFADSFGGFDQLHEKLDAINGGEQLWINLTQHVAKNDLPAAQAAIQAVNDALKGQAALVQAQNTQVAGLVTQLQGLGAGQLLAPYLDELQNAKDLTGANLAAVMALAGDTTVSFAEMQKAAQALGISEDDLGQSFQQAKQQASWQTIIDSMDTLVRGGTDINALLGDQGLQKKIQDLVTASLQFGTTIPANAEPWIQSLINQGVLLDASGHKITDISKLSFADTLETSVQKLIDSIKDLIDKLGGASDAAKQFPPKVTTTVEFHGVKTGDWPDPNGGGPPGDPNAPNAPGASSGAYVTRYGLAPLRLKLGGRVPSLAEFRSIGTDTIPAMLTPGELVLNTAQQGRVAAAMAAGGSQDTYHVSVDATNSFFDTPSSLDRLADRIGEAVMRKQSRFQRFQTG